MVKHKASNLVDVGSSPEMGVTSYDIISNEKSQLSIILLSRLLGATGNMDIREKYLQILSLSKSD